MCAAVYHSAVLRVYDKPVNNLCHPQVIITGYLPGIRFRRCRGMAKFYDRVVTRIASKLCAGNKVGFIDLEDKIVVAAL